MTQLKLLLPETLGIPGLYQAEGTLLEFLKSVLGQKTEYVIEPDNKLSPHIRIYLDGEHATDLECQVDSIREVEILVPLSGG